MSVSSFHFHFKAVTAMSPLQYQKRLRLMEARQIMLVHMRDAVSTAYRVGYESPSQFSREYARVFGNPPGRDIQRLTSAPGFARASSIGEAERSGGAQASELESLESSQGQREATGS